MIVFFFAVEDKKSKTLTNIKNAKNKIRHEISDLNDRLKQSKEAIARFKDELARIEGVDEKIET